MTRDRLIETYFGLFGLAVFAGVAVIHLVFKVLDWINGL